MGLIARALEIEGIATVMVGWNGGRIRLINPPRSIITRLERGVVFGKPNDTAQQRRVLDVALDLLGQPAPMAPVTVNETMD